MDEERDGDDELLMGSQISSDPPRWRPWIYNNPDTISTFLKILKAFVMQNFSYNHVNNDTA